MEKLKLFEDLGRATLRGIRKCPKCGTFNGTRGISCKNKECKLIFKTNKNKPETDVENDAVKIICSTNLQIYSVKLQEIREHYRCFVHLPLIEGIEALQDDAEITVIKQSAAMCYAATCRKPMDDMCTITLNLYPCLHTHSVVNCLVEAVPLMIKKMVVKVIPLDEKIKEEIYSLASKSEEHLVQRISKSTMVVKCEPVDKHPLGFLHCSFFEPKKKCRKYKIFCECQSEHAAPFIPKERDMCLHFYLCICAFASDPKLLEEFKSLIEYVLSLKATVVPDNIQLRPSEKTTDVATIEDFFSNVPVFSSVPAVSPKKRRMENIDASDVILEDNTIKSVKSPPRRNIPILTRKKTDTSDVIPEDNTIKSAKSPSRRNIPILTRKKIDTDEALPCINFDEWLGTITERINQTMHYQLSGSPEPLVFQVPQVFFDVLQHRISNGTKKKRLPNSVVGFTRMNTLPMGFFSRYTWHITNILHVKRIFDTFAMPLEITRSFVENKDGTYSPYNPDEQKKIGCLADNFRKTQLIKPVELKTFLKVGTMYLGQKEPTPFIIEWIPDILPKTHTGELTIKFEYGHQRNGLIEKRDKVK